MLYISGSKFNKHMNRIGIRNDVTRIKKWGSLE